MTDMQLAPAAAAESTPTLWGLSPTEIHDRFWASRGVQVVRRGEPSQIVEHAELFLLIDPQTLIVFRLRGLVELLSWLRPRLVLVRLRDDHDDEYREIVRSDDDGHLLNFERVYEGLDSRHARVGLTPHRHIARCWQSASSSADGWKQLRREIPAHERQSKGMPGRVFDGGLGAQQVAYLKCLMETWASPDSTVPRAAAVRAGVWTDQEAQVSRAASIVGSVWVGAGRAIQQDDLVVGPAILWDKPESRPSGGEVHWQEIEPSAVGDGLAAPRRFLWARRAGKRIFDVLFSLLALALTLPLYPFIALAILIEDGWPIFFTHKRETHGGREFPCLKFRSMRRDADEIKAELQAKNVSDGPQFFVENDPRSTRVGAFLRKTQLDEIPQFWNVLVGHMSVVGPRPSPRQENQFCPAWREARLSVRPGVTGLWQIRRTRAPGLDFQEWIRFDLEYVERMSWHLDLWIIWKTIGIVFRGGRG